MGRHATDRDRNSRNRPTKVTTIRLVMVGLLPTNRAVNRPNRDHSHEYDRDRMKIWSSLAVLFAIVLAGCAEGAKLVQETGRWRGCRLPFKGEQGSMLSSFRQDALALMKEKCGGPYTIVREGETKGRTRMASPIEGAQEPCRSADGAFSFAVNRNVGTI